MGKKNCFRKQNKKKKHGKVKSTHPVVSWARRGTETKKKMMRIKSETLTLTERRERREIERREERIKIRRGINLIYKRDVIFAFCECRERDTHTEVFGKRAVGVGTCNGAHSLCTIFKKI